MSKENFTVFILVNLNLFFRFSVFFCEILIITCDTVLYWKQIVFKSKADFSVIIIILSIPILHM